MASSSSLHSYIANEMLADPDWLALVERAKKAKELRSQARVDFSTASNILKLKHLLLDLDCDDDDQFPDLVEAFAKDHTEDDIDAVIAAKRSFDCASEKLSDAADSVEHAEKEMFDFILSWESAKGEEFREEIHEYRRQMLEEEEKKKEIAKAAKKQKRKERWEALKLEKELAEAMADEMNALQVSDKPGRHVRFAL